MKKHILIILCHVLFVLPSVAQTLTLEMCRQKAQDHYPLAANHDLINRSREYNLSNAAKGYLPQFVLSAKATYQSDVIELPIQVSGISVEPLSKGQYQVALEMQQSVWDGGATGAQRRLTKEQSKVEHAKLQAELYTLNDRVNQIYFGVLLMDRQLKRNALMQQDLTSIYMNVNAYLQNGVAQQADLDAVEVELLNVRQQETELLATRTAYIQMLSLLIGEMISSKVQFEVPAQVEIPLPEQSKRPELLWFDAQVDVLNARQHALNVELYPRLGAFVQGAYGNPGLNMLKNEAAPYYIAGLRLSWNFGSLYTRKNSIKLIETDLQRILTQRQQFLFDTRLQATQQYLSVQAMRQMLEKDDEIIRLRHNIRKASDAKLKNGVMSVSDFLRDVHAENAAQRTREIHEIQLLLHIYQLKYTTNH